MSTETQRVEQARPQQVDATVRRRRRIGVFLVVLAVLTLWTLALSVAATQYTTVDVNAPTAVALPAIRLPVRLINAGLASADLAFGLFVMVSRRARANGVLGAGLVAFGIALVLWAGRGGSVSAVGLLSTTVVDAVPLILGSLSGIMCERAGVINIGIEGQFLGGAFLGAMIGSASQNLWLGMLAGALGGALLGALLAVLALRYGADQIIVGVVIVTFATGLTSFLTDQVLNANAATLNSPAVFPVIAVPLLDRIPLLGPVLFDQNVFWYLAIGLLVVIHVGLNRTRWGLRVRATGEHPMAVETAGLSVLVIRYRNVILGGAIGGLGGASFTIGSTGQFAPGMVSGLGYVALAAMIFGGWRPLGAFGVALLFSFADSLQSLLAVLRVPIPSPFLLMVPYLITIAAVAGVVGRVRPPAADGKPYRRE